MEVTSPLPQHALELRQEDEESVCSGKGGLQRGRNKAFNSRATGSLVACGKEQGCSFLGRGAGRTAGSKEARSISAVPPSLTALWCGGQGTGHLPSSLHPRASPPRPGKDPQFLVICSNQERENSPKDANKNPTRAPGRAGSAQFLLSQAGREEEQRLQQRLRLRDGF